MHGCGEVWCSEAWEWMVTFILIGMAMLGVKAFGLSGGSPANVDTWV